MESTQADYDYKKELDELKDILSKRIIINESMKTRSTSQIDVDATNFEKSKINIFCKICKKSSTHFKNKYRYKNQKSYNKNYQISNFNQKKKYDGCKCNDFEGISYIEFNLQAKKNFTTNLIPLGTTHMIQEKETEIVVVFVLVDIDVEVEVKAETNEVNQIEKELNKQRFLGIL